MILKHLAHDSIPVLPNFSNSIHKEYFKNACSHLMSLDTSIFERNESLCMIKWKILQKPITFKSNFIKNIPSTPWNSVKLRTLVLMRSFYVSIKENEYLSMKFRVTFAVKLLFLNDSWIHFLMLFTICGFSER